MPDPTDTSADAKGGLVPKITALVQRVMKLKPVRVFLSYGQKNGALMASGMAYSAIFAAFAALWVGFSIIGFVLRGDIGLRDALIASISQAVPGLIDPGDGSGAVDPSVLLDAGGLSWTGAIALVGLLFTALGFLANARSGIRALFELPQPTTNFLLLKAKDLGLAVAFGLAVVISTVLSTASTAALGAVLDFVGVGSSSVAGTVLARIVGLAIVLALDTAVLAALYRLLAGIPIPRGILWRGALLGGIALGVLKTLGGALLGGTSSNPLLASFAIIIGLLIFFNLVCQVLLIFASWIAVGMKDAGVAADPAAAAAAEAEAARIAELERLAAQSRKPLVPRVLDAVFRRPRDVPEPAPVESEGADLRSR